MTINIFVLKGDVSGKIVVVRFFFCRVYLAYFSLEYENALLPNNVDKLFCTNTEPIQYT